MTTLQWLAEAYGSKYAQRLKKAMVASRAEWVRTEAGRLCVNQNNRDAYWRNPEKHRARKRAAQTSSQQPVRKRPAAAAQRA